MRRFQENPVHLTLDTPEEPVQPQSKRVNPLFQSCKVMMFSQNGGFTFGEKEKSSESSSQKKELQNANFIKQKRFNFVKASLMVSQKRSTSNPKNPESKLNTPQNQCIGCAAKSENSFCIDDEKAENSLSNNSEPFEKISINQPEQELESYYTKKIRVLEGKIKKYKLDSETQLMKIQNQNKKLRSSINTYQKFVKKQNSELLEKIEREIAAKEERMFSDTSSNSSRGDQKITPVLSQVIQIKIEGKRLCDHIKALENNIKAEQSQNIKLKKQIEKLNQEKLTPNNSLRKWSMQVFNQRYKKPSFHASKISTEAKQHSKKEKLTSLGSEFPRSHQCQQCSKLKQYILKFNQKLKNIKC